MSRAAWGSGSGLPALRGMALILVVVVIAALVAISAPFAISMRLHEKSARGFSARVRARRLAEAARNDALAALLLSHPDEERRARLARGDNNGDDEDWDSLDELSPKVRDFAGKTTLETRGTKSTMTELAVRDERSKIDLNGAPAEVIANLFGVTVTTGELDYNQTDFLPVEDVRPFYSDGDPTTLDGIVRVNGEFIGYRDVVSNPPGLKGLVRGMFFTRRPPPDDGNTAKIRYPAGSLVQDFRGWKVAWDPVWRYAGVDGHEGELARFETPSAIRKIADWDFGTFAAAYYFQQNGVTFEKLKEWGIVQDKLDRAGVLESVDLQAARAREDAEQKKRREAAEKGLRGLGVRPEIIARFGGDRAVIRAWELLEGLDPDQRESLAKSMRDRAEKLVAQEMKHQDFWRAEVKRQLDDLIAIREKTPEIETIGRIELERVRPYITVDSPHEGEAWTDPQVVNHAVRYEPYRPVAVLRVQDGRRFRNGMVVRVRPIAPPGVNTQAPWGGIPEYRRIVGVVPGGPDHTELHIFPQLERDYEISTCEVSGLLPKPVNANTAPKEVLVALLTGLQTRLFQVASATGQSPPNFVTPKAAAEFADRILAQPLHSHQELRALIEKAIEENVLNRGQGEAILQNAVDPANRNLSHAGVPLVYASGDVYEITATGIVNDEAANEIARVKTREVVQAAPPRDLVWTLDAQSDFQDRVGNNGGLTDKNDPRSLSPAFTRGLWSHLLDTFPQDCFAMPWLFPQRSHLGGAAPPTEVKLATGRDWDQPRAQPLAGMAGFQPGIVFSNHYDMEREGHPIKADAFVDPPQMPRRTFGTHTGPLEDGTARSYLGPGSIRAWFQPRKIDAAQLTCFFDTGVESQRDRLTLEYDGPNKELVATIHDESLDLIESGGNPRPSCEVRFPASFKPENWYHLALAWKGSELGDLAMCLDGLPVGTVCDKTTHSRAPGTKTTALIDANTLTIPVADTSTFPSSGFIRIGGFRDPDGLIAGDTYTYKYSNPPWSTWQYYGEVLYYTSKTPTSFVLQQATVNPWGAAWLARHQAPAGQPQPTPPQGSTDPTRTPLRGTGRYSEEPDPGYTPLPVLRGSAHDVGTPVYLWGYTLWLKNGPNWPTRSTGNPPQSLPPKLAAYQETLRPGRAALLDALPENTPSTLVYKPNPTGWNAATNPRPVVVQPTDAEVPVVWADKQGGWPQTGFIRIGNERLYYTQIKPDPDAPRFVVQRGIDGTQPQAHYLWEHVVLESIRITSDQDYARRNTLLEPEVFLQLTPPHTPQAIAALQDPNVPCTVEWVSVLNVPAPYSPTTVLIPAIRRDSVAPQGALFPTPQDPRFIALPQVAGRPLDLPLAGDGRWFGAMIQLFDQMRGRLPQNPASTPVTVTPQVPGPPRPGMPPGPPPLPGGTKSVKDWLKGMDGNESRARRGTAAPVWGAFTPTATSARGGRAHAAGEKVLPTFILGATHPNDGRGLEYVGKGDFVTLADDASSVREERGVLWVAGTDAGWAQSFTGDSGTGVMVALDDFVQRQYLGAQHARIVRFPSGQLPYGPQQLMAGGPTPQTKAGGAVDGRLDEIVVTQEPEPSLFEDSLRSNGSSWPLANVNPVFDIGRTSYDSCLTPQPGLTQGLRAGVIFKLDDEIVAVNDVESGSGLGQAMKVVRGMLRTQPELHGPEASFWWNFPFPRLAVADYGFSLPNLDQIALRPRAALHDKDFYVAIDRGQGNGPIELMPIREQRKNFLLRPRDRFDRGTFRGAFGTAVADPPPGPGEVLFDWPFRHFDRYQPLVSSIEGVFFEATKELKGAYFESITWDAAAPNPYTRLLVAVRVDGQPSWDAVPAKAEDVGVPGKLYLFEDPKKDNKILLRGDRVEVRVYMTYKPQAFSKDGWKQTPILKDIRLTYRQPTRVRRREEMLE